LASRAVPTESFVPSLALRPLRDGHRPARPSRARRVRRRCRAAAERDRKGLPGLALPPRRSVRRETSQPACREASPRPGHLWWVATVGCSRIERAPGAVGSHIEALRAGREPAGASSACPRAVPVSSLERGRGHQMAPGPSGPRWRRPSYEAPERCGQGTHRGAIPPRTRWPLGVGQGPTRALSGPPNAHHRVKAGCRCASLGAEPLLRADGAPSALWCCRSPAASSKRPGPRRSS